MPCNHSVLTRRFKRWAGRLQMGKAFHGLQVKANAVIGFQLFLPILDHLDKIISDRLRPSIDPV